MNYSRRELLEPLAERYVLGVMSRRARRRFSRLFDDDARVAKRVLDLEALLLPMAWSVPSVTPSELLWQRISRQAGLDKPRPEPQSDRTRLRPWPTVAAAASLALAVTSVGWWQASQRPPEVVVETVVETVPLEPSVGVVADAAGSPLWVAKIYEDLARADVVVANPPEAQAANDYELWILRDDGVPVSLGLLPQSGQRSLTLDAIAIDALSRGSTIAVSLEPLGGSPQPVPTGPVLYTAPLFAT